MLSLLSLAELSPPEAEVRIIDEQVDPVPEDEPFDLVGITAMTATAPRAYELAARFRRRGIPVVLGGFHPTLNPGEALQHADAVVVGPAYGAWQSLLGDLREGGLQRLYRGDPARGVPARLPRRLIGRKHYVTVNSTFATLGCRNACRFCSIQAFHGGARYARDVQAVAGEVASFRERFIMFVDDNLTQDRAYARELFRALTPLRKKWVTQVSVDVVDDTDMLRSMREAGCIGVFVGLETFSAPALSAQKKGCNVPERYREAVERFHRHGMFVEAGVIFGFDADTPRVFGDTLSILESIGIDAVQASILTPLPGTGLFDDMRDRIFDTNWEHYDYRHVVFTPTHMSAGDLQAGADWLIAEFYRPRRIARRVWRWARMPGGIGNFIYPLALNWAYYGRTRAFAIRGRNPSGARYNSRVFNRLRVHWERG